MASLAAVNLICLVIPIFTKLYWRDYDVYVNNKKIPSANIKNITFSAIFKNTIFTQNSSATLLE